MKSSSVTMNKSLKIGIWLDHGVANLMEFTAAPIGTNAVELEFAQSDKRRGLESSKNLILNKEQHRQTEYYKRLADLIQSYEHIILFGPTYAKVELFNVLRADRNFTTVTIEIKQTGQMAESEQRDFVRDYFSGYPSTRFHIET